MPQPQDEEEAPNSVLQRAILMYVNQTSPHMTSKWITADVRDPGVLGVLGALTVFQNPAQ